MYNQVILYRGPLERSRLKLLISSILVNGTAHFLWVYPGVLTQEQKERFENFIANYALTSVHVLNDKGLKALQLKLKLKQFNGANNYDIAHFIGFRSYFYATAFTAKKKVWYVNGIPEEALLHNSGFKNRIKCYMQWRLAKSRQSPDLIVPVSKPMARLIHERLFNCEYKIVPITVDTSIFKQRNQKKKYFTYLGTGAPWQALDLLEKLWFELYQQDNSIQYRVISRDARCRILATRLPESCIEFVASSDFSIVADYLAEARVGFLIRRDNVVNNVSFPTKYAEYVASGAFVVLSEIKWDLNSYVNNYKTGLLVNNEDLISIQADRILKFLQVNINESNVENFEASTIALSNNTWKDELSKAIQNLMKV